MKTTNFTQDLKNTIVDKLNDYKGKSVYGCDLSSTLFEVEDELF